LRGGNGDEDKIETVVAAYDQQTCLSALIQTLQHEELALLVRSREPYCPAKQRLISRMIVFDNLSDLRQSLFGLSTSAKPPQDPQPEEDVPPEVVAPTDPISSEGVEEEKEADEAPSVPGAFEAVDRRPQAAKRIQLWWRRCRERQYLMESSELSYEAQYYRRFSPLISKYIVGTSKRHELFRKLLRGPGLLVILCIEMLSEQLEESLYTTRTGLQASNIDAKAIEALQKRLKAIEGFHKITETLRRALSADSSPEALKASNLSLLKGRFTLNTRALLQDVKKSNVLQDREALVMAEEYFLRGVDAVKKIRAA
ncbi:hypothetical protein FRC07_002443, partial [Ceratobasidium sp. 392]